MYVLCVELALQNLHLLGNSKRGEVILWCQEKM
jgi:hypothetical protein